MTFWHFLTEDWSLLYSEMPAKITDEEKLPKIPNLDVAQWKFYIKMNPNCEETQKKLKDEIKEKEMAPFYAQMCDELGQKPGTVLEFHEFYETINLYYLYWHFKRRRSSALIPEQWKDDALLAELKKKNEEKIAALDKKIADAEELEGITHA